MNIITFNSKTKIALLKEKEKNTLKENPSSKGVTRGNSVSDNFNTNEVGMRITNLFEFNNWYFYSQTMIWVRIIFMILETDELFNIYSDLGCF